MNISLIVILGNANSGKTSNCKTYTNNSTVNVIGCSPILNLILLLIVILSYTSS